MKTVVGLYDHFEDAQQAVQALRESGFDANDINMIASDSNGQYAKYLQGDENQKQNLGNGAGTGAGIGAVLGGLGGLLVGLGALAIPGIGPVIAAGPIVTTLVGAGAGAVAGGIVGALVDMGIPEEHAKAYAEGIRQGGTLVAVQTDDQRAHDAESILNRFHPVDVNERSRNWQSDQSQVGQVSRDAIPVTGDEGNQDQFPDRNFHRDEELVEDQNIPVTGNQPDMSIPVVEEDLLVGKREVDRGGVQVNAHVEEEPVEEDINLRQEHVTVERRPVDRPASDQDFDAFKEGTFEVKETGEEPVVEKRARVVEEVNVNKDVQEDTRTIRDTVRHTEVDVQPINRDMGNFDQTFQQHFQTNYASSGHDFSYYQPAYRYGYDLANNPQYRGYDWNRLEPIARQDWERRGMQGSWFDVKNAIRHAWESAQNKM